MTEQPPIPQIQSLPETMDAVAEAADRLEQRLIAATDGTVDLDDASSNILAAAALEVAELDFLFQNGYLHHVLWAAAVTE